MALPAKLRNFVFTLNNPTEDGPTFLASLCAKIPCRYVIFQLERGESGTPHYQGYVELEKQTAFQKCKLATFGAHIEPRRGTAAQAAAYASKDDTRVDGPWTQGQVSGQGKRSDIQAAVEEVQRNGIRGVAEGLPAEYVKYRHGLSGYAYFLARSKPRDDVSVTLLIGPTGVGKTRACWERAPELVAFPADLQWFDGYLEDDVVLFDEFDGKRSQCKLAFLLRLLDRYPLALPVKGAFVAARFTQVYITTNFHPRDWYDYTDRENHYAALKRRVSTVLAWTSSDRDSMVELTPDHSDWDAWWRGPQPVVAPVLGRLDDYVEHEEPKSYWNFW